MNTELDSMMLGEMIDLVFLHGPNVDSRPDYFDLLDEAGINADSRKALLIEARKEVAKRQKPKEEIPKEPVKVPPIIQKYRDAKKQSPTLTHLFKNGGFFETYEEDAEQVSRVLNMVLLKWHDLPLIGFPTANSEKQLQQLIQAGYKVAVHDQIKAPFVKGLVWLFPSFTDDSGTTTHRIWKSECGEFRVIAITDHLGSGDVEFAASIRRNGNWDSLTWKHAKDGHRPVRYKTLEEALDAIWAAYLEKHPDLSAMPNRDEVLKDFRKEVQK